MRFLAALSLLVAGVVLTVPAVAQQPAAQPSQQEQSVLTPGDSIRIEVWRRPDFSGDFVVAPDGSITHPLYRAVRVGGIPFATAENNVRTFLKQFEENPQFVMEPLIRVAISGDVIRPQVFAARPETTIGEVVARAGGVNQFGARNRIRLLRLQPNGQQDEITINLSDPGNPQGLMPVRSGDQIIVDRKRSFTRDILIPALGIIGSIASVGLLIDRIQRNN